MFWGNPRGWRRWDTGHQAMWVKSQFTVKPWARSLDHSFFSFCKVGMMIIGKFCRGKNRSVHQVVAECLHSSRSI